MVIVPAFRKPLPRLVPSDGAWLCGFPIGRSGGQTVLKEPVTRAPTVHAAFDLWALLHGWRKR